MHAITSVASGDIVVGGDFSRVGGQTIDNIDALDPVTGQSLSWSFPSSGEVLGLVTGPDDNVYGAIGGSGGKVRSWTNTGTLRWTVYTDGDVNAVAYDNGQVIAGGHWIVPELPRTLAAPRPGARSRRSARRPASVTTRRDRAAPRPTRG